MLDDKLLRAQISEEDKLKPLHEQITRLQEELAAERLSREVMDERKSKEIKAVEQSCQLDLTVEKRVRAHPSITSILLCLVALFRPVILFFPCILCRAVRTSRQRS